MNYRSGDHWRAIDNRLERTSDGDLANRDNRYDVELPDQLDDGAVTVEHGAASLGFELRNAESAAAQADGASATYADALPAVDVRYDVLPDAVKETLVLKSADAPREYQFDLDLSGGLAAKLTEAGELVVVGTDAEPKFIVPAPVVWQAGDEDEPSRDPVSFAYDESARVLTLRIDDRWLSASDRRFPVSVDPWVALPSDGRDCTLSSKPTEHATSFCLGNLQVGMRSGYNQSAAIDFNAAEQLPDWVTVREAYAALWLKSAAGTWQEHAAHALTRPFVDGQASWTNAGTGVPWTTPGGDFRTEPASVKWFNGNAANMWTYWSMSDQVQRWADGTDPDHGLLLRATSNPATWGGDFAASSDTPARQPYFVVDYEPTYGEDGNFTFVNEDLPGIRSGVNVATGVLTVSDVDLQVTEDAPGFALERFYNSTDDRSDSPLARGWKLGAAPKAATNGNQHLIVETPSGTVLRFPWDEATQTYGSDRYENATATATANHWIVERASDDEKFFFDKGNGRLVARERAGETGQVLYTYDSAGVLKTITAPGNKVTTLHYNGDGTLAGATLPGAETVSYGYADGRLAHRTKGDNTTSYAYAGGRLSQIWSPDGKVTFQYDSAGRVIRITRITDLANNSGPSTTFAYDSVVTSCPSGATRRVIVTPPGQDARTYCVNAQAEVLAPPLPDEVPPEVVAIGGLPNGQSLADHDGGSIGPWNYTLSISADDADGDGIANIGAERDGAGLIGFFPISCALTCPATAQRDLTVNGALLPEGPATFRVGGADQTGNQSDQDVISVLVDKTAPAPPTRLRVSDYDASNQVATLDWVEGDDPAISANVPGAGTTASEHRYSRNGGTTWSSWTRTESSNFTVSSVGSTDTIVVQVRTIDHAANVSAAVQKSLTMPSAEPAQTVSAAVGPGPGFDSCTPKVDYARSREVDPDYQAFKERTWTLGAQLTVDCTVNNTDKIELTGQLAVSGGGNIWKPKVNLINGGVLGAKKPDNRREVIFRGIEHKCDNTDPDDDGTNNWTVMGTITYYRSQAVTVTHDYQTDRNNPEHLHCPTRDERRAQVLAGWRHLSRRPVDGGKPGAPSSRLRASLGPPPWAPANVDYAWDAHHIVPIKDGANDDLAKVLGDALRVALFRCAVHPNEARNGVYLRGRNLKKTLSDGITANPSYVALKRHSAALARRTWHADTTGASNVLEYLSWVSNVVNTNQLQDRCAIGNTLRTDLNTVAGQLRKSELGTVAKPNH